MSLDALYSRLALVESKARSTQSNVDEASRSEYFLRVEADIARKGILGTIIYRVPHDYYELPLVQRAKLLSSPVERLCKTLVLENVGPSSLLPRASLPLDWTKNKAFLPQSRYIAVVVPYVQKLDIETLARFVRASATSSDGMLPPVKLVQAENGDKLTGFPFNGVTVFGGKIEMPIIVCKVLLDGPQASYIWLGGGEVDLKLRIPVPQLMLYSHACDCSIERDSGDEF